MTKPQPYVPPKLLSDQVDDYLRFKAESKALEAKIDALKPHLTALQGTELTGTLGTLTVDSVAGRKSVDWDTIAIKAKVPQSLIDAHTKVGAASSRINIKYTKL